MIMIFACPFSKGHFDILNKVEAENRLISYHFVKQKKGNGEWVETYVNTGQLPEKGKQEDA